MKRKIPRCKLRIPIVRVTLYDTQGQYSGWTDQPLMQFKDDGSLHNHRIWLQWLKIEQMNENQDK